MGTGLCKPCVKNRKTLHQTSSILDRVISQASNQDQCLLYRLANYKKGGELIDAYNLGGQAEVEKLIKEQFGILMYADGKGQMINRAEYLRWKFRDQEQVVLPIEASLSAHDPLAKWSDHEACWQMQYRGSLGESLLHLLIICDTKIHTRLARTLLKCFPKLALDVVEGEEYLGASALHLSIAYNNNELVQDLVEAGANVNQRAIGSFFLPRDQQKSKPAKTTDYEGLAYLGEYPLAWAACCANESVYNLLLDSGAHPDLQDNFGNMILHMVVVCDKLDMFGYALRHPKLPASNGIANKTGLTPLTLACKLGRAEVFKEMLELSAKEFWRYSNITCSAYPLNALDTLLPDGRTNWNSALFIILNGTKEEHLDMLDGGIIQRLLEEKWKTFARNQFLKRLLILLIHLLCLSLAVYLRPDDSDESLLRPSDDLTVMARYACEIGTLLGVLSYVVFQQGDEIKNQGLLTFLKQQTHAPAKAIFLVSNLLILACIPCRLAGDKNTEEAILVFAVPGSWFLLMFFAGAVRLTGPFVTMIYSMITGDMLTFGIIYTIVLFGFSQSFFFLYKGYPGVKNTLYNSYPSTWMALFQITLGDYSYSDLSNTTYPSLSKTVFAIFMVFVPILLLNMLIAMMGNTYAHVIEQSEKEWMKQWAKIVVTLERAVPQSDAHHYLQEYSIKLGPGDEPGTEQRGVMVIKSKSKTRAKQRKGAVSNWKRVGKITITELRKRGMTGEQLRNIMWGRASISTPVKVKSQIVDPLQDMEGNNLGGCFGGALTAALDVMAFTHDLDLTLPNGSKVVKNTTDADYTQSTLPAQFNVTNMNITNTLISQTKPTTAKIIDTGINACGNINQIANSNLTMISSSGITNQSNLSSKTQLEVYVDPLRELILLSDKNSPDEIIQMFAFKSANIENFEEVKLKEENASQLQNCISDVFSIKPTNSKMKIEEQKKRLSVFELSDSDGFGEAPLLGRVSRQRRARSANIRNRSAKSNKSDNTLMLCDLSPSETSTSDNNTSTIADDFEDLNFAEERIRQVKESLRNKSQGQDVKSLRPSNIDQAFGICNDDEVISEQVLIKGLGNGLEIESGNVQLKFDRAKSNKSNQRSKTARSNRIAPTEKCQERRGKSAIINSTVSATQDPFPDPLEPWSIKNIVSMNTILAWEDDTDSM